MLLLSSRFPVIVDCLPAGEVTRDDSPIIFWLIISSGLLLGVLGLVGLLLRIDNRSENGLMRRFRRKGLK
jgi:hypothetical protein